MKKNILISGLLIAVGLLASLAIPQTAQAAEQKRYIVSFEVDDQSSFNSVLSPQAIARARSLLLPSLSKVNATQTQSFDNIPAVAVSLEESQANKLRSNDMVVAVEESQIFEPSLVDVDAIIGYDNLHGRGFHGAGASVVVLDTGTSINHPALNVIDGGCFSNTVGIAGVRSACPNGQSTQLGRSAADACVILASGCDHGTHVAGIASSAASNIRGVAPRAGVIAINVFSVFEGSGASGCGFFAAEDEVCMRALTEDIMAGLDHALTLQKKYATSQNKVASVNMSMGSGRATSACDSLYGSTKLAIQSLVNAGVSVVAASGNSGYDEGISMPACLSNVLSVGATDKNNTVTSFSNVAPFLDVYAPGASIASTIPGKSYTELDGTSMASPVVAGAIAILKTADPSLTPAQIKSLIKSTASSVVNGDRPASPAKLINLKAAVNKQVGQKKIGNDITVRLTGDSQCRVNHLTQKYTKTRLSLPEYNRTSGDYYIFVRVRSSTSVSGRIIADAYDRNEGFGYGHLCNNKAFDLIADTTDFEANEWRWVPIILDSFGNRYLKNQPKINEVTLYFAGAVDVDSFAIRTSLCPLLGMDSGGLCNEDQFERNLYIESIDSSRFVKDNAAHNGAYTQFGPRLQPAVAPSFENDVLGAFDDGNFSAAPVRQAAISLPTLLLVAGSLATVTTLMALVYVVASKRLGGKTKVIIPVAVFAVGGVIALTAIQAGAPAVQRVELEHFQQIPSKATVEVDASASAGAYVKIR